MSLVRFRPEAPRCGCSSSGRAPPCQGGGSEFEPRRPLQSNRIGTHLRSCFYKMVPWPSGKARVCKTLIRQFKSGRYLQTKNDLFRQVVFCLEKSGTDRFEKLNATVRWTVACRRIDGGNTFIFLSNGKKNADKSGRYLIKRPISKWVVFKDKHNLWCAFLFGIWPRFGDMPVAYRASGSN